MTKPYIFTPKDDFEKQAIQFVTAGEDGWKGSLYAIVCTENTDHQAGVIFTTKPPESDNQEWLIFVLDRKKKELSLLLHKGTPREAYFEMVEAINLPKSEYNPPPATPSPPPAPEPKANPPQVQQQVAPPPAPVSPTPVTPPPKKKSLNLVIGSACASGVFLLSGIGGQNPGALLIGLLCGGVSAVTYKNQNKTEGAVSTSLQDPSPAIAPPPPPDSPQKSEQPRKSLESLGPGDILFGKYRIESKLGEGGYGATYIVSDQSKNAKTTYVAKAQKLTGNKTTDDDLIERFEREAAALEQVGSGHGQVPSLFDYFDDQGNFFLIQEQVKGEALSDVFLTMAKQGHLFSNAYAVKLITELLEVVEHLHSRGIIHRDIKPQNIILRQGDGKPVLIDFGLIKYTDDGNNLPEQAATMAGTPGYMPIEQQMGKALFQSDLYAVGMVFLLITTGCPPHRLEVNDQMEFDLDFLPEFVGELLSNWLKKAIAPLPQRRFATAEEMRISLLTIRDQALIAEGFGQAVSLLEKEGELSSSAKQGRTTNVDIAAIEDEGELHSLPSKLEKIITTQKELDAFNVLKRLLERHGYDGELLEMNDQPDFCDIHYQGHTEHIIVRLYCNDESDSSFSIVQRNGEENNYVLSSLRRLSKKADKIIARLSEIEADLGKTQKPLDNNQQSPVENGDDDKDIVEREIRPLLIRAISDSVGNNFNLLTINFQEEPFKIDGQFEGLKNQAGRIFDYELTRDKAGKLTLMHKLSDKSLAMEEAADAQKIEEEDCLAKQEIYTVGWLQRNFSSIKAAKEHFGVRARSWEALAERISKS
jgi:serine/threonine-protein kinase